MKFKSKVQFVILGVLKAVWFIGKLLSSILMAAFGLLMSIHGFSVLSAPLAQASVISIVSGLGLMFFGPFMWAMIMKSWENNEPRVYVPWVRFENGQIKTFFGKSDFIELVWRAWGEFTDDECQEKWLDKSLTEDQLTDDSLKNSGLIVVKKGKGEAIILKMIDGETWLVESYTLAQAERFVQLLEENS